MRDFRTKYKNHHLYPDITVKVAQPCRCNFSSGQFQSQFTFILCVPQMFEVSPIYA